MIEKHEKLKAVLIEYMADAEKNNADFFIASSFMHHLERLSETPIKQIAYEANTTLPSVSKFCRKLGYESYHDLVSDDSVYSHDLNPMVEIFSRSYDSYKEAAEAYYEEGKKNLLRVMDSMNHEEIRDLAEKLSHYGNIMILASNYNKNVFSLLAEILMYHGIRVQIVNRHNALDIYESLTRNFDLVLVSSLTNKWVEDNRMKLQRYSDSLYIICMHDVKGFHTIYSSDNFNILTSYFTSQDYLFAVFMLLNYELVKLGEKKNQSS